jgi:hypothetical protein
MVSMKLVGFKAAKIKESNLLFNNQLLTLNMCPRKRSSTLLIIKYLKILMEENF